MLRSLTLLLALQAPVREPLELPADLVLLSEDVLSIDPAKIHEVQALLTIFDGRVVYRSENAPE